MSPLVIVCHTCLWTEGSIKANSLAENCSTWLFSYDHDGQWPVKLESADLEKLMSSEHLVHEIKRLGMIAYYWQYMIFLSNRFYGLGLITVQFQKSLVWFSDWLSREVCFSPEEVRALCLRERQKDLRLATNDIDICFSICSLPCEMLKSWSVWEGIRQDKD